MNEQDDFAYCQVEPRRRGRVEDLVDILHFEKMISGAERPKLRLTPQFRARADRVGIRSGNASAFFGVVEVCFRSHAMFDCPARTFFEDLIQIAVRYAEPARLAGPGRNIAKELMHELAQSGFDIFYSKGTAQQANAAIDIEPYAAR